MLYKYAFMMKYERDSNYQMFVVACLSRWWFMLKLVEADWAKYGGPGPSDTVAVIVSGTADGAKRSHQGGSSKRYVRKMIKLLAKTVPFNVDVVENDGEIFAQNLWIPGVSNLVIVDVEMCSFLF